MTTRWCMENRIKIQQLALFSGPDEPVRRMRAKGVCIVTATLAYAPAPAPRDRESWRAHARKRRHQCDHATAFGCVKIGPTSASTSTSASSAMATVRAHKRPTAALFIARHAQRLRSPPARL